MYKNEEMSKTYPKLTKGYLKVPSKNNGGRGRSQ